MAENRALRAKIDVLKADLLAADARNDDLATQKADLAAQNKNLMARLEVSDELQEALGRKCEKQGRVVRAMGREIEELKGPVERTGLEGEGERGGRGTSSEDVGGRSGGVEGEGEGEGDGEVL